LYVFLCQLADSSHVKDDDECLKNLIMEESDRNSFTAVVITGINMTHINYLRSQVKQWTRQLASVLCSRSSICCCCCCCCSLSSYNFKFSSFFVLCVSVKVKLSVLLLCVCVHSAWKGHPRNDLYLVGQDIKPYSLTQ